MARKYTLVFFKDVFDPNSKMADFGCLQWERKPEGIYMAGTDFEMVIPYGSFGMVEIREGE